MKMNELFAERFHSARVLSGFSLQDLADKLGNRISKQALHKYEKGDVVPDSEMIGHLSDALNVRPDFFFRETKVEVGNLCFRKLDKLPVKEQNRIVEYTKDVLARYLELEEILGIETRFTNPLEGFPALATFDDVEKAATFVREKWNLGTDPIYNTMELLEDNHIKVIPVESEDSFDGMQTWVNHSIPVIVINTNRLKVKERIRFTVLHELGHLLLPMEGLNEKAREKYCNQFAAAMLFPKEAADKELGMKRNKMFIQEFGELKKQYGISIQALIYRANDLGIISNSYVKQLIFLMESNNWKIVEPVEYIGDEGSNRFKQLLFRALAEEQISMSKAAVLYNQTLNEFRKQIMVVE